MAIFNPNLNLELYPQAIAPDWPGGFVWHWLVFSVIIMAFVIPMVMGFIWIERRGMARMQLRRGPNRTGPLGLLQAVADAIKVLLKEDIVPANGDKIVHWLAPVVAFTPVLLIFAVIPFQDGASLANLDVGLLYIIAISTITTLGIFMAGWGSSNKFAMLAAMRDIAAVVSYEIPVILALASVVIMAGTMSLNQIVLAQNIPFILLQPLGFFIFFVGGCAEINRSPFDLLEADSELTAGFHTEYSGMKFAMFYLVEYAEALAISAIIATVFLGGWRGPILPPWLWLIIKIMLVFFVMVWTRTTLPRVRIDQMMALAWKFLLPLALINLFVTAIQVLTWPDALPPVLILVNFAIMVVLILLWSKFSKLGWGRIEV